MFGVNTYLHKIICFFKSEAVLSVTSIMAGLTCFIVKPSAGYLSYIDDKVLILLFCLMAVVAGFTELGVADGIADFLVKRVRTARSLFLILTLLCFFFSMLITNDVALITFVPFSILVMHIIQNREGIIFLVTAETVAANLGSTLTPVGNPQNLYLYSYYRLEGGPFFAVTLPLFIVSLAVVAGLSLFVKNREIQVVKTGRRESISKQKLLLFLALFVLCILAVFSVIRPLALLFIVSACLLPSERKLFCKIDYALLMTFVGFFIFVGNVNEITQVKEFLLKILSGRELTSALLLSQCISNVPAAVLLSKFTDNYTAMIVGTNIGGLGTVVASLASLISLKFYIRSDGANVVKYLSVFTAVNLAALILLYLFSVFYYGG